MRKTPNPQKKYYFSDKLRNQLAQIPHYPLTIVEAPSGFGKTTAVREYLKEHLPQGAREYWYTCLGESATAWKGICELLSHVNETAAGDLKSLDVPTIDTLFYMVASLRNFRCKTETYLVIDNYHLLDCGFPRELIDAFSMHGSPDLHMIFITQQLGVRQRFSVHNDNIHAIGASSFFFDREGTAKLFQMEGIRLAGDELEKLFISTEGWISAIRLQMINYAETGSFDLTADIEQLVENAIWNRLDPDEKDFLLSVSVMDSFTALQAAIMLDLEVLPDKIEEMLKTNDFIRYLPDKQLYSMHSILHNYLRNLFHYHRSEQYQNQVYQKAGRSCAASAQLYSAAKFFFQVRDFDAILALPFSCAYFDNEKEKQQPELIFAIIDECPEETLCKYPFTMLVFGYQAFFHGRLENYQKLCRLLGQTVERKMGFDREQLKKIEGEYTLLASMADFNDIFALEAGHKKAWGILRRPSEILPRGALLGCATPSVLSVIWRESGELENGLAQVDELSSLYRKLAKGSGSGIKSLLRAEALLMRGEDDSAEILCHKALYAARSYNQVSICICAELVLALIAILRGDADGYSAAAGNIQNYAKETPGIPILRMVEQCMSAISLALGIKDYVAPWLHDMESIKKVLYAPVVPLAQPIYLKLLLMDKRYNELYGISNFLADSSKNPTGNIKYLMPKVYRSIYLAMAKRGSGNLAEARKHLNEALDLALPDQIFLPFAHQEHMADFLSECFVGLSGTFSGESTLSSPAGAKNPPRAMRTGAPDRPFAGRRIA